MTNYMQPILYKYITILTLRDGVGLTVQLN